MKYFTYLGAVLLVAVLNFQPINAQDMNPKITTFLMFEGQAEEAITFYTSLFDNSEIVSLTRSGPDGPGGPDAEGTVQRALFTLNGQQYMAIDSFGHNFTFTPAISLFVQCDSEEELDKLYEKLMEGGTAAMPLDDYGFSKKFGWVQDRFGVSWQLNYGELTN
ncbi:MAG: VOC family protein [Balneolaceae bacterium]|nr:MAG: VOC family protein [Balneolaceae bacterium]